MLSLFQLENADVDKLQKVVTIKTGEPDNIYRLRFALKLNRRGKLKQCGLMDPEVSKFIVPLLRMSSEKLKEKYSLHDGFDRLVCCYCITVILLLDNYSYLSDDIPTVYDDSYFRHIETMSSAAIMEHIETFQKLGKKLKFSLARKCVYDKVLKYFVAIIKSRLNKLK